MRFIAVLILSATLTGCGAAERFGDDVGAYVHGRGHNLDEMTVALNGWLGKSKADYIRAKGPFAACAVVSPTEEVCRREIWQNGSIIHTAVYSYNEQGIAVSWRYFGNYGKRASTDPEAQAIKPKP